MASDHISSKENIPFEHNKIVYSYSAIYEGFALLQTHNLIIQTITTPIQTKTSNTAAMM